MKKYYIEIHYRTGDSDKSYDETSNILLEWDKLDVAKANLKRIKDYQTWYDYKDNLRWRDTIEEVPQPTCVDKTYNGSIHLVADDGGDYMMSVYWCGCFESLHSAKIKENNDPELTFIPKGY